MKCPNDKTEMEKGYLLDDSRIWATDDVIQKAFRALHHFNTKVFAMRCPNCGKIELYSEVKK